VPNAWELRSLYTEMMWSALASGGECNGVVDLKIGHYIAWLGRSRRMVEKCRGLGFGGGLWGWLCAWFGHELFGVGEGLRDGNFRAGLVDVVDVDGRIEHENCRAGF
jgi:hypothetical protein